MISATDGKRALSSLLVLALSTQPFSLAAAQVTGASRTPSGLQQQVEELRRTQELLMEMLTSMRLSMQAAPPSERDRQKVEKAAKDALNGLGEALGGLPRTDELVSAQRALETLRNCESEAASTLRGQTPATLDCDRGKAQESLEAVRRAISKSYEDCVSAIKTGQAGVEEVRTINVMSEGDRSRVAGLAKGLPKEITECIDSARRAGEQFDSAMNSMALMMNMAASMCAASGGNPYVCGTLFVLAMLSSLFQKGGGDGDGKGDGKGPSEGRSTAVAQGGNERPNQGVTQATARSELRGAGGDLVCSRQGETYVCRTSANPNYLQFPVTVTTQRQGWASLRYDPQTLEVKEGQVKDFTSASVFDGFQTISNCHKSLKRNGKQIDGSMIVIDKAKVSYLFAWQGAWRAVMEAGTCPSKSN